MRENTESILRKLTIGERYPVPFDHQEAHIKTAIKTAGVQPIANRCYENSQKCVALQSIIPLSYAEGVVITNSGLAIVHAWVIDEKQIHHDLTLKPLPKIICFKEYSKVEIRRRLAEVQSYDPMDEDWCKTMHQAHSMKLPTNLPLEEIHRLIEDKFEQLLSKGLHDGF